MYLSLCTDRHGLPQILDLTETCLARRLQSVARFSDDLPRVLTKSITLIVEAQLAQCSSKSDHKYTHSSSGRAKCMVPPTRIVLDLRRQITTKNSVKCTRPSHREHLILISKVAHILVGLIISIC